MTADPSTLSRELSGSASSEAVLEAYAQSVMNTFGPPKRVFVRGEGCYLWDAEGRRYLDLLAGLAVTALGHAHPTVLSAITGQIATLGHVSNFFTTPAQVALAERLTAMVGSPGPPGVPRSSRPRAPSTVARWVPWRSPTTRSTASRSPPCRGRWSSCRT